MVHSAIGPTAMSAAASMNGGVYRIGLVDEKAGNQRRQNAGDVADEIVDAGPQPNRSAAARSSEESRAGYPSPGRRDSRQ